LSLQYRHDLEIETAPGVADYYNVKFQIPVLAGDGEAAINIGHAVPVTTYRTEGAFYHE
jgi:hypothetical protein